jgi:hypothetical protein
VKVGAAFVGAAVIGGCSFAESTRNTKGAAFDPGVVKHTNIWRKSSMTNEILTVTRQCQFSAKEAVAVLDLFNEADQGGWIKHDKKN